MSAIQIDPDEDLFKLRDGYRKTDQGCQVKTKGYLCDIQVDKEGTIYVTIWKDSGELVLSTTRFHSYYERKPTTAPTAKGEPEEQRLERT